MKNTFSTRLAAFVLLLGLLSLPGAARADNDDMFPPAPAAASSINFDGRGFLVHGKRTFIASGGMEYTRIPRALWRDRLLRLKRAGFNCVEIYTFWNAHEPRPNEFDFTGDLDLDAFLKTVQSLGLYAIVRVGPYVCAEWDSGGYPVWLRFVPGLRVREDNAPFLAAVDRYWDKLMPIVAANQINRGGPVILVQLENEHPLGWGKVLPNAYFVHLRDKAVALGLQVPYFFSGLHHSSDPAGDSPWSSKGRKSPWMSTEFWSLWYDRYGATDADADTYERRFWKVLAYGGNGLNIYMFHGGSNFGFTNDDEDTASYDYGAAIGQMGDLRPTYYRFKRAALFARSFQDILENSDNATDTYKTAATDPDIRVTARKSPSGTILFLDNPSKKDVKTQVKEADGSLFPLQPITVKSGKIVPIVRDFPLLPGVVLERATPLLAVVRGGGITTVVTAGTINDMAEVRFRLAKPATDVHSLYTDFRRTKGKVTVRCPLSEVIINCTFRVGGQTIRVLGSDTFAGEYTWFLDKNIVVNGDYISEASVVKGKLHVTEETWSVPLSRPLMLFKSDRTAVAFLDTDEGASTLGPLERSPTGWETRSGSLEAGVSYEDAAWKPSTDPLPMGADGDASAYAWYRSTLTIPKAGSYTLHFTDGGDRASVFIDGKHVVSGAVKAGVPLTLPAGTYTLAVLTTHYGRSKLFNYLGPIDAVDAKGLRGPVTLNAGTGQEAEIKSWRVQAEADADHALPPTNTTGAGWADGTTGPDVFHGRHGFAWYLAPLPASTIPAAGGLRRLRFENVDDNATVFLNGKRLAAHEGWGTPFDVPLDAAAWNEAGPNTLAVLVENTDQGGGIQGKVMLQTVSREDEIAVTGWKMHGGLGAPDALTGWASGSDATADGAPAFYRARFPTLPSHDAEGRSIYGWRVVLRVETEGLSHGFMWLNGHNLGRYPEKTAVKGLYLPECWLRPSGNELVIYDEEGRSPTSVILKTKTARDWTTNTQSYYVVHPVEQ